MEQTVSCKGAAFVRQDLCRGCGLCTTVCPTGAIKLRAGKARVSQDQCKGCLVCAGICPAGAIGPRPLDPLGEVARRLDRLQGEIRRLSLRLEGLRKDDNRRESS